MTDRPEAPRNPAPPDRGADAVQPAEPLDAVTLDAIFAEARGEAPALSDALRKRLMSDAEAEAARRTRPAVARLPPARPMRAAPRRVAARRRQGVSAWAGLVAAGAAGLWLGFATPGPLAGLADTLADTLLDRSAGTGAAILDDAEDLDIILFAFDDFLQEG